MSTLRTGSELPGKKLDQKKKIKCECMDVWMWVAVDVSVCGECVREILWRLRGLREGLIDKSDFKASTVFCSS